MKRVEVLLELVEARLAGERLVVAEEGEDDVGLGRASATRRGVPKSAERSRSVSSSPEKPRLRNDELVLGEAALEVAFRASRRAASGRPACCR